MNIKNIVFMVLCTSSVGLISAKGFVKEKKASNEEREACCQAMGEQIKACAQLIEDLAKTQKLLLESTAAFLENESGCYLLTANKRELAALHKKMQDLTQEITAVNAQVKNSSYAATLGL